MAITKEQWNEIEGCLSGAFGRVTLQCDGYELTLTIERVGARKYAVIPYINGTFKTKWVLEDCEERRRFLRPVERFVYSAKLRNELIKIYGGKRAPKAKVEEFNKKLTSYAWHWTDVKALRRHLVKSNQQIDVVKIGHSL